MRIFIQLYCLLTSVILTSQTTISGKITNTKGTPIVGANVYLKGTYDGTSSNEKGFFSFTTRTTGKQTLIVSFISFENYELTNNISSFKNITIKLREDVNTLDAVIINAGSFKAGTKSKATVLSALDVVTTAGAMGDVLGAFQTLPGTSSNADDGRLFIRGGNADETQIFIDGIHVASPYPTSIKNIPVRSRFSSFLFKGMNFSSGGYSAEYGQALSGILTLNTIDKASQEKTDISISSVGIGLGNTQIWNKNSLSINASYTNLKPYYHFLPNANNWKKPFESYGGELVYRHKTNNTGLLKIYGAYSKFHFDFIRDDINYNNGLREGMKNKNIYINTSYKERLSNNWRIFGGISYTNDQTDTNIQNNKIENKEHSGHLKLRLKKRFSNRLTLLFGTEYFMNTFNENITKQKIGMFDNKTNINLLGSFIEADIFLNKKFATKIGIRSEYLDLLAEYTFSPRVSFAYKTGDNTQLSLAYGTFYQQPNKNYMKFIPNISSAKAQHFIANYQYAKNKQFLRIEAYYKKYNNLIKYNSEFITPTAILSNEGSGYAKGIDFLWKDTKNIKYLNYWISYSYLDTKRNEKNYPTMARPSFASKHNVSLVGKYWIDSWKTSLGLTYNFASGRTYTNPNIKGFLNSETKNYNTVNLGISHLITTQKIIHFEVSNILGTKNVYGYTYKNTPNNEGIYDRQAITPNTNTFFFLGFFWTISNDKKSNQLNNL